MTNVQQTRRKHKSKGSKTYKQKAGVGMWLAGKFLDWIDYSKKKIYNPNFSRDLANDYTNAMSMKIPQNSGASIHDIAVDLWQTDLDVISNLDKESPVEKTGNPRNSDFDERKEFFSFLIGVSNPYIPIQPLITSEFGPILVEEESTKTPNMVGLYAPSGKKNGCIYLDVPFPNEQNVNHNRGHTIKKTHESVFELVINRYFREIKERITAYNAMLVKLEYIVKTVSRLKGQQKKLPQPHYYNMGLDNNDVSNEEIIQICSKMIAIINYSKNIMLQTTGSVNDAEKQEKNTYGNFEEKSTWEEVSSKYESAALSIKPIAVYEKNYNISLTDLPTEYGSETIKATIVLFPFKNHLVGALVFTDPWLTHKSYGDFKKLQINAGGVLTEINLLQLVPSSSQMTVKEYIDKITTYKVKPFTLETFEAAQTINKYWYANEGKAEIIENHLIDVITGKKFNCSNIGKPDLKINEESKLIKGVCNGLFDSTLLEQAKNYKDIYGSHMEIVNALKKEHDDALKEIEKHISSGEKTPAEMREMHKTWAEKQDAWAEKISMLTDFASYYKSIEGPFAMVVNQKTEKSQNPHNLYMGTVPRNPLLVQDICGFMPKFSNKCKVREGDVLKNISIKNTKPVINPLLEVENITDMVESFTPNLRNPDDFNWQNPDVTREIKNTVSTYGLPIYIVLTVPNNLNGHATLLIWHKGVFYSMGGYTDGGKHSSVTKDYFKMEHANDCEKGECSNFQVISPDEQVCISKLKETFYIPETTICAGAGKPINFPEYRIKTIGILQKKHVEGIKNLITNGRNYYTETLVDIIVGRNNFGIFRSVFNMPFSYNILAGVREGVAQGYAHSQNCVSLLETIFEDFNCDNGLFSNPGRLENAKKAMEQVPKDYKQFKSGALSMFAVSLFGGTCKEITPAQIRAFRTLYFTHLKLTNSVTGNKSANELFDNTKNICEWQIAKNKVLTPKWYRPSVPLRKLTNKEEQAWQLEQKRLRAIAARRHRNLNNVWGSEYSNDNNNWE